MNNFIKSLSRSEVIFIAGILLLTVLFKIYFYSSFGLYFSPWEDAACRTLGGSTIFSAGTDYKDLFASAWLPMHFIAIAGLMHLGLGAIYAGILLSTLSGIFLLFGLFYYSKFKVGSEAALLVLLVCGVSFLFNHFISTPLVGAFFLGCIVWAIVLMDLFWKNGKWRYGVLAILLLSIANLLRYEGWLVSAFIVSTGLLRYPKNFKVWVIAIAASFVPLLTMCLAYIATDGHPLPGLYVSNIETESESKLKLGFFQSIKSFSLSRLSTIGLWWVPVYGIGLPSWILFGRNRILPIFFMMFGGWLGVSILTQSLPPDPRYLFTPLMLLMPFAFGGILKINFSTFSKGIFVKVLVLSVLVFEMAQNVSHLQTTRESYEEARSSLKMAHQIEGEVEPTDKIMVQSTNFCSVALISGVRVHAQMDNVDFRSKKELSFYKSRDHLLDQVREGAYAYVLVNHTHFDLDKDHWSDLLHSLNPNPYEKIYEDEKTFILKRKN